jgi:DNA (cytosine-5)-methyltransferase 1
MMLIDMFSGAGGLTEGFFKSGYNFISHIEMNKYASETLETRSLYHYLKENGNEKDYYAYLNEETTKKQLFKDNHEFSKQASSIIINEEISKSTEDSLIKKIKKNMDESSIKKIDGIIGGPPCQAYSIVGRGRSSDCMKGDHRNYLYEHYIKFLKEFKPDFFVFENVPGMLSARTDRNIFEDFHNKIKRLDQDYTVDYRILHADHFNVLQSRKRLIVVGHKCDKDFFETPFKPEADKYIVSDILEDLPPLVPGKGKDSPQKYNGKITKYLEKFHIRTKKDVLIQHRARNHNEQDREIYRYAINAWETEGKRIRYDKLPSHLKTHKNQKSFIDRFKVIAGNLPTAHTIMAHISKDGHYYIHPDINQARSLTVREAARIQSFPDNFKFEGPMTAQYMQIGNAVPPLMAEGIAIRIKEFMGC